MCTWAPACRLGLGVPGAAIAYAFMQAAELAMLLATAAWLHYVVQLPHKRTWCGWSKESFRYWGTYLQVMRAMCRPAW